MNRFALSLILFITFWNASAQVGIGTSTPETSAQLDVSSTSRGLLPPRMTREQRSLISSPVPGLIIWCSNCGTSGELQVYNGTSWTNLTGGSASLAAPTITTATITSITATTATSGGNITSDGGSSVTARGVVWSTSTNPTIVLSTKTSDGTGTETFSSSITGLAPSTTYYLRAYATNGISTSYGAQVTFTTSSTTPTVTTASASAITSSSATSGGNVTSDGGSSVTARGIVWSTSTSPTIALSTKTSDGTGTGSFSSSITGLTHSTTYYVRAYATNSNGTSYGTQITFTTSSTTPSVTTTSASAITSIGATSGGNVTSDGGSSVTARGIVWSTSTSPTITLSTKTSDGTGTGSFTSSITGLSASTTYYVRAYATNSNGTSYGNEVQFTTAAFQCGVTSVTFTYRGTSVTYGTVTGANNKCWLDRNLGATNVGVANSHLFQWGRADDGHQVTNSSTTTGPANTRTPGSNFITVPSGLPGDWISPQQNDLWTGTNPDGSIINNPCPAGWRIPTIAEFQEFSFSNLSSASSSALKLTATGYRLNTNAIISDPTNGYYWTSDRQDISGQLYSSWYVLQSASAAGTTGNFRANGAAVRCIRND